MCTVLLHHTDDYSTRLDRLCCALQFKTSRRITGADIGWISVKSYKQGRSMEKLVSGNIQLFIMCLVASLHNIEEWTLHLE